MTSVTDYLLDVLVRSHRLTATEAERVLLWANESRVSDLVSALVQLGVLREAAGRTLELMQKGFITGTDPTALFTPDGLARLKTGALPGAIPGHEPAPANTTRKSEPVHEPALANTTRATGETNRSETTKTNVIRPVRMPAPEHTPANSDAISATVSTLGARADSEARNSPLGVGKTLGKCLLTGVIGKGGRGVVYSALHTTLNIPVAIKVLTADDREGDDHRDELRHEAQLLARLNHPNVVRVLDFEHTGTPYVVMEMVEGPSLADLIVQTGGLRVERAIDVILQAACGLSAAWDLNIVHRDIKPANLLLTRDGTVKVADLGLALSANGAGPDDSGGVPLGTCGYMAPEQARAAGTVDCRADMYSLGATFYQAVTGRMPFAGRNAREMLLMHATAPLVPACEAAPGLVDRAVSEVIDRMMAKNPADRYATYGALIEQLRQLATRTQMPSKLDPPQSAPAARGTTLMGWLFRKATG